MAEYRTLTGEFSLRGVVQDVTGDSCEFQSGNMKMGSDADYNDHRVFATLTGGDASDETLSASTIKSATLTISVKKESTTTTNTRLYIYFYNKSVGTYSAQVLFSALNGEQSSHSLATLDENTTSSQTVSVTLGAANSANVKNYGVGFTVDGNDIVRLESVSIEYTIEDEKVPPTLGLSFPNGKMVNGTYYHDPHKSFLMKASYSQVANAPMEKMDFVVFTEYPDTSSTYTFAEITDVSETVTWYPDQSSFVNQCWERLPREGAVGIRAKTEWGYYENTLIVPFKIAESEIAVVSPTSGAIVKTDEDLKITFSIKAPAELSTMEKPDEIYVFPGYDGETGSTGTLMTGKVFTLQKKELIGHESVNLYISTSYNGAEDKYGNTERTVHRSWDKTILATFYIQEVAGTNNITLSSNTKPIVTVNWESAGQTAFQVKVDEWVSEIVYGDEKSYKIPFVLSYRETHAISVRIQDGYGSWSEWTTPVYNTANDEMGDAASPLEVKKENGVVEIRWRAGSLYTVGVVDDALLYRNGELIAIAKMEEVIELEDETAIGYSTYQIILPYIDEVDQGVCWYTQKVTIDATPATDGITVDGEWIPLRYTIDSPQRTQTTRSEETYTRYYAGRKFPVSMRSGRNSKRLSLGYGEPGTSLADTLEDLVGKVVLYRNRLGEKMWGELNGVTSKRGQRYCDVQFELTQVDKNETLLYNWAKKYKRIYELGVGDKVLFGKYQVGAESPEPIAWIIVDKDHTGTGNVTLMAEGILDRLCYDAKEPDSEEYYYERNGNSNFQLSNIYQWLNSDAPAGEWYTQTHDTDQAPDSDEVVAMYGVYADRPGFLNGFNSKELTYLKSVTIQSNRPMYENDAQVIDEYEAKVYLPSVTELGYTQDNEAELGSVFMYFGTQKNSPVAYPTKQASEHSRYSANYTGTWSQEAATPCFTRSATTGKYTSFVVGSPTTQEDGVWQYVSYSPYDSQGIRPVLNISSGMKVTVDKNESGYYVAEPSGEEE